MIIEKPLREEMYLYEVCINPVLFGEFINNIDKTEKEEAFEYTIYQKEMLCDFNSRVSLCTGRSIGKCVQKDSMIENPSTGEYRTVKEWYNLGSLSNIISINENTWKQSVDMPFIAPNGIKNCIQIDTTKGFKTIVTEEHPILTNRGFVTANKLRVGDFIATAKEIPFFGNNSMKKEEILAVAHFIAEGTYRDCSITTVEPEVLSELYIIAEYFDCKVVKNKITYHIVSNNKDGHGKNSGITGSKNKYFDFLSEIGLRDKHSTEKFIPQQIFTLNKADLALFLNRLFSDDGWCINKNNNSEVGYCSASEKLARDIQHLLLRFGIVSTLNHKNNDFSGAWCISIKGNGINKFRDEIGFIIERKQRNLIEICNINSKFINQADLIPVPDYNKYRILKGNNNWSSKLSYYPTRNKAKRILNKDDEFNKFENSDSFWVKIKNLTLLKEQETYAIEVKNNHTHLIDNIWSHNTFVLMSLILWILVVGILPITDFILFATPSRVHLEPVWNYLVRYLRSNSFLKNFIDPRSGINGSEYTIRLLNQSQLVCRIAGQSGTGANLVGLHTSFIMVDESEYFPWVAFQEMQPDLNTWISGNREIIAGVPTGIREKNVLYYCDMEDSDYSKHRVTADENPRNTPEDRQRALDQFGGEDSDEFIHFWNGLHGKPVFALFDRSLFAMESYPVYKLVLDGLNLSDNLITYVEKLAIFPGLPNKKYKAILGIDLGYSEPTAIIIAYIDEYGRIKFHGRIQLNKVSYPIQEKFIDMLDSKFDPVIIGIDKGNAGMSTIQHLIDDKEYLHKNYNKRIYPVDFSSSVFLGIDSEGKDIKTKTKPFSTTVLQDYSNNHRIVYSTTDLELVSELERMTYTKNVNGEVVYRTLTVKGGKKGEDHFTSALLCLSLAYYMSNDYAFTKQQTIKLFSPRWLVNI